MPTSDNANDAVELVGSDLEHIPQTPGTPISVVDTTDAEVERMPPQSPEPEPIDVDDVDEPAPPAADVDAVLVNGDAAVKDEGDVSAAPPAVTVSAPDEGADVAAATDSAPAPPTGAAEKPKSSRAQKRSPSPSPPPPPRPSIQTIRLTLRLGGPDNYAVNIAQLAKETGQRPPTPPPIKRDSSDSEGEDEGDGDGKAPKSKGKGKGGKKKNLASEYYDLTDPFIDDTDLAVDERQFIAQTKQQGFYVSSGDVALLQDKSPKKPKSKKPLVPTIIPLAGSSAINKPSSLAKPPITANGSSSARPASTVGSSSRDDPFLSAPKEGSRESPIALLSDNEGMSASAAASTSNPPASSAGQKRKPSPEPAAIQPAESVSQGTTKKKRKYNVQIEDFHPELQDALRSLKENIAKESFEQKSKFPPALKPVLNDVALIAIRCGEYNDNFFSLMPRLFPYNKFTMSKLIKRTVFPQHQALLMQRQEELLKELKVEAEAGFAEAKETWEKSVGAWEKRQEKQKADHMQGIASAEGTPVPVSGAPAMSNVNSNSTHPGGDDADSGAEGAGQEKGHGGHGSAPPQKKFRLTERMREIIWELVVLSNEGCRIENEKNALEGLTLTVSEQGTRKVLYQKIVAAFPDGWMSSGYISREVSIMKKRYEAQQQED